MVDETREALSAVKKYLTFPLFWTTTRGWYRPPLCGRAFHVKPPKHFTKVHKKKWSTKWQPALNQAKREKTSHITETCVLGSGSSARLFTQTHTHTKARIQNSGCTSVTSGGNYGRNICRIQNSILEQCDGLDRVPTQFLSFPKIHLIPFFFFFCIFNNTYSNIIGGLTLQLQTQATLNVPHGRRFLKNHIKTNNNKKKKQNLKAFLSIVKLNLEFLHHYPWKLRKIMLKMC